MNDGRFTPPPPYAKVEVKQVTAKDVPDYRAEIARQASKGADRVIIDLRSGEVEGIRKVGKWRVKK